MTHVNILLIRCALGATIVAMVGLSAMITGSVILPTFQRDGLSATMALLVTSTYLVPPAIVAKASIALYLMARFQHKLIVDEGP